MERTEVLPNWIRPAKSVTALLLAVLATAWLAAVVRAPIDRFQGVIQKILYVHVPAAFSAYLGFVVTALGGALYLARHDERYDRVARSAAEVGVLFCTVVLLTGPVWARGTWGKWWSWDLRLTLTLLLWFLYLAYLLLRGFTEGSARAARFAAVYGIVGLPVIVLNYFAIKLAQGRTLHPSNLGRGSLGEGMGWPFLLGALTSLCAFAFLLVRRVEVETLRGELLTQVLEARAGEEFGPAAQVPRASFAGAGQGDRAGEEKQR